MRRKLGAGERRLNRNARGPHALGEQRRRDVRAFAGALAPVEGGHDRRIEADGGSIVTAAAHRPGRRRAGIARHRQQAAACPVRCDVEARQIGIRPVLAEAGEVGIDQTRVPTRDVIIFEVQLLARMVRRVDDEHVGPVDELDENLLCARRLQIERDAALVAVGEMPGIGFLGSRLDRDLVSRVATDRRAAVRP